MIVCSQSLRAVAKEIQNGGQYNGLTCVQKIGKKTPNIFKQEKAKITTAVQFLSS